MEEHAKHTIHEAIQASREENEKLQQSVLIGWVVIAEWVNGDGTRSLVRMAGTPGDLQPPEWQTNGYLHEALFGRWNGD